MPRLDVHALQLLLGACAGLASMSGHAQSAAAPDGCPQYHCTPEATGVMAQPIITSTTGTSVTKLSTLGTLYAQGCSGNGTLLACLSDASGTWPGTLKIIQTSISPDPPMTVVADDYLTADKLVGDWSRGQVPFVFPQQPSGEIKIGAGDGGYYKFYTYDPISKSLAWTSTTPISTAVSGAKSMGLTDLGNGYGVVARDDGLLALINMATGAVAKNLSGNDVYKQLYGTGSTPVTLTSPPSASDGVLYVVANDNGLDGGNGFLYAVSRNALGNLAIKWTYTYDGKTGASPVEVKPSLTPYSKTLVLLHVPGKTSVPQPQLRGILNNGGSYTNQWHIDLTDDLNVAPTVDEDSQRLYFTYELGDEVFGYPLYVSGAAGAANTTQTTYDLLSPTGLGSLILNGHIGAIKAGPTQGFTLLLTAAWPVSPTPVSEFMIAFTPDPNPIPVGTGTLWKKVISGPAQYTGAWNVGSPASGEYCPLVVEGGAAANGLVLVCNH